MGQNVKHISISIVSTINRKRYHTEHFIKLLFPVIQKHFCVKYCKKCVFLILFLDAVNAFVLFWFGSWCCILLSINIGFCYYLLLTIYF